MRSGRHEKAAPPMPPTRPAPATSLASVTIADLGDFAAHDYAAALDAWCRTTLRAWGVGVTVDAA